MVLRRQAATSLPKTYPYISPIISTESLKLLHQIYFTFLESTF